MRPGPPNNAARARARGSIAPALLLDVLTPAGDLYFWSDRPLKGIDPVLTGAIDPGTTTATPSGPTVTGAVDYKPWLLGTGSLSYYRSLQTDTGSVTLQNLSGDVLQSEWERIVRKSTLEGSLYVLRYYSADLEWAWIEQHGTLSVGDTSRSTVQLSLQQLMQGQDDTPAQTVSETCQLVWGEKRCGATGSVECLYSYGTCQVPEHFVGIQTSFEVNNPESAAQLPTQLVNRKRAW